MGDFLVGFSRSFRSLVGFFSRERVFLFSCCRRELSLLIIVGLSFSGSGSFRFFTGFFYSLDFFWKR